MAGGAADTAGTAADGTVIIDSELGRGARRRLSRPLDLVFRGSRRTVWSVACPMGAAPEQIMVCR
jgi:hypothetical protein